MHQLDLFGGEPAKPTQPKKKAYQLVKPDVLVEKAEEVGKVEGVEKVEGAEKVEEVEKVEVQSVEKAVIGMIAERAEKVEGAEKAEVVEEVEGVEKVEGAAKVEKVEVVEGSLKKTRARIPLDISRLNPSSPKINVPEDEVLFSKQYYPIGEVAAMFNVNISLIRFWENEFDILQPRKNGKGDRLFRPEDVKNLKMIFFLLKEKKYTIEGAKTFLKKGKKATQGFETVETLKNIKSMLIVLKSSL
jgi:DNA-binding transcriptional MerR regulator